MKNVIIASAASAMIIGGAAFAQDSETIPLTGELPRNCEVSAFLNGPFDALDMTSTAVQGAESLSPICNYGGTLTVDFDSANDGELRSGSNAVPYIFIISGGLFSGELDDTVVNWPAVGNAVQTRSMSVQLTTAATLAGTYTDVITATVTPN